MVKDTSKLEQNIWENKIIHNNSIDFYNSYILVSLIKDLSKQMLVKIVLEPEWEARFESYCYGYRPGRSNKDVVEVIFTNLYRKPLHVANINLAYTLIDVNSILFLNKINTLPKLTSCLQYWLDLGILNEYVYQSQSLDFPNTYSYSTKGCILSPLLVNIYFYGLQSYLNLKLNTKEKFTFIQYGHQFLIMHSQKNIILQSILLIKQWILQLGFSFDNKAVDIQSSTISFDFIGYRICNVGQKGFANPYHKVLIYPSIQSMRLFTQGNREIIQNLKSGSITILIKKIRFRIFKWVYYYDTCQSFLAFKKLDEVLFSQIRAAVIRKHPNKSKNWIKQKYFPDNQKYYFFNNCYTASWILTDTSSSVPIFLPRMRWFPKQQYIKVLDEKSPYDGDQTYWSQRYKFDNW